MADGAGDHWSGQLARSARELEGAATWFAPHLAGAAATLAGRLETGRFDLSVVGEFKRGKSTLLNALVGREVLPTGVLPLTAVATELNYGAEQVVVHHLDGTADEVGLDRLADYVTEDGNPQNRRNVDRVEVRLPAGILEAGATLVDTPGLGSVFRHNTEAAREALLRTDGAVVVFSADTPFSEQERALLDLLAGRSARTFFVLNRIDHLTPDELDRVRRFIEDGIAEALRRPEPLYCLSARDALAARLDGDPARLAASGFPTFETALRAFLAEELVAARLAVARREIGRLATLIEDALAVEEAATRHEVDDLDRRIIRFRTAADEQRRAFEEDRVLLGHTVARIGDEVWRSLATSARSVPDSVLHRLDELAASAPRHGLEETLRAAADEAAQAYFEPLRQAQTRRAGERWQEATAEFRTRTAQRLEDVRRAAEGIFDLRLGNLPVPDVADERERFYYLLPRPESTSDLLSRGLRHLEPSRRARRRLAAAARRQLLDELDMDAGRARSDLAQRLDGARHRFEQNMARQLDDVIDGILTATERAKARRTELADGLARDDRHAADLHQVTGRARAAAAAIEETAP